MFANMRRELFDKWWVRVVTFIILFITYYCSAFYLCQYVIAFC